MSPLIREKLLKYVQSERGSISVLTIGLFSILLTSALILSNVTTVYLAKRSLIIASEAAVQRGAKNLDQAAYYSGEYNLMEFIQGLLGAGEEDPGIPIDCSAGLRDARELISNWNGQDKTIVRSGISEMQLRDFQCDGFQIYLESSAIVELPFPFAFIGIEEVEINSSAGGLGERSETNNYYGVDIG
jgi:hypothetical protein